MPTTGAQYTSKNSAHPDNSAILSNHPIPPTGDRFPSTTEPKSNKCELPKHKQQATRSRCISARPIQSSGGHTRTADQQSNMPRRLAQRRAQPERIATGGERPHRGGSAHLGENVSNLKPRKSTNQNPARNAFAIPRRCAFYPADRLSAGTYLGLF